MASLWYTNSLVSKLANEERRKAELLARAFNEIVMSRPDNTNLEFYSKLIEDNDNIPVIVVDTEDNLLFSRNLDSTKMQNPGYARRKLQQMKDYGDPLVINLSPDDRQYLYFNKSTILIRLTQFPYIQLFIILLFISLAYAAFSNSRKAEQNQVWVGLSKETAHQLGTPISSLMAWYEMLKGGNINKSMLEELGNDIKRLEKITERFSKIGSRPVLKEENIVSVILSAVNYLQSRLSGNIHFNLQLPADEIKLPLNSPLFEWVIENLCKNAADALDGKGEISVKLKDLNQAVYVDIADTGKGISKSLFKTVFKPGFTTKHTGWGLGLSLVKRIVESYHDGRIFVHHSELGKGTIFRIVLKKNIKNG